MGHSWQARSSPLLLSDSLHICSDTIGDADWGATAHLGDTAPVLAFSGDAVMFHVGQHVECIHDPVSWCL